MQLQIHILEPERPTKINLLLHLHCLGNTEFLMCITPRVVIGE